MLYRKTNSQISLTDQLVSTLYRVLTALVQQSPKERRFPEVSWHFGRNRIRKGHCTVLCDFSFEDTALQQDHIRKTQLRTPTLEQEKPMPLRTRIKRKLQKRTVSPADVSRGLGGHDVHITHISCLQHQRPGRRRFRTSCISKYEPTSSPHHAIHDRRKTLKTRLKIK